MNKNPFSQKKKRTSLSWFCVLFLFDLKPYSILWVTLTPQSLPMWTSPRYVGFGYCPYQPASTSSATQLHLRTAAHTEAQLGGTRNRHKPGIMEKIKSLAFLCQAEPKRHFHSFLHLPIFQKAAPGVQPFHSSLFTPSTAWLFKFLFWDLVDSESLLATRQAWADKKTEVFSQKLLSGNNVSNKMKLALHSWKIYYNSPYAHRSNVNTNQLHSHGV